MQNTGCLWPVSRLIVVEKQKDEQLVAACSKSSST